MAYDICKEVTDMNHEKLLISERIDEVKMMCDREHPIYEQISCFSIALYVIGYFNCADLMSFDDFKGRFYGNHGRGIAVRI